MVATLRRLLDDAAVSPAARQFAADTLTRAERNLALIRVLLELGCYAE
jgi:hypothetical protein